MNRFTPPGRKLALGALVATIFSVVSGGPFGLEDLVRSCGALGAAAILVVTPLLWAVPTAMLVGELAAALPEDGGYYVWVRRGLGPFWGVQEAWLSLTASIFDMGLYPTLFVEYAGRLYPPIARHSAPVGAAIIVACAAANLRGAGSIGRAARVLTALIIAPFAVLAFVCITHPSARGPAAPAVLTDPLAGVLVAMWNYMGWDNSSTFAGEVAEPRKTYPRAVLLAVLLVLAVYLVPVSAVAIAGVDTSAWSVGAWVDLGRRAAGPALAFAIVASGCLSALATCSSLVLSYSRLPAVLARDGFLPRFLSRETSDARVPYNALFVCALAWMLSLRLPFMHLLLLDMLLYGLSLVLEFAALVALRVREPALARPFRIPGGLPAVLALSLPPTLLVAVSIVRCGGEHLADGGTALVAGLSIAAVGPLLYAVPAARKTRLQRRPL